ncbi:MAG: protein-L-isoaspartate(D-aspartate) O-methyltransferase [Alphaproteobacteria bacterium]|nr:protein-L-isoaspartate(D-aspartate) O-methyltransferase [Alphaproteobacteria bacterium]
MTDFLTEIADKISNQTVLDAMKRIDRHAFVPELMQNFATRNVALPIECEQTISQPYIVALMSEALLAHHPHKILGKILEIGTGSGYQAAILACLVDEVYSIERHELLHKTAKKRFEQLGLKNIHLKLGDGWQGWQENAPYDGIIITAAAPEMPTDLLAQLAVNGVMIVPLGADRDKQILKKIVKKSETDYSETDLLDVVFVPFVRDN